MIDDRTSNLDLPKPSVGNTLAEDLVRLRAALDAIDAEIAARQEALGFTPENPTNKGVAGGYAGLDGSGKVPSAQLPSFVDDVLEFANLAAFPGTGEAGKIYVALDTNLTYRWGGSAYTEISASPGSTDAVPEGSVNKYFTDARARAAQFIATGSQLGLIKVGAGLAIGGDGTLSTVGGGGGEGVPAFNELIITPTSNGQTVFTPAGGYEIGEIELYLNGVLLYGNGDDYTASNGTTFTLAAGVNTTDLLLLRRWTTSLSFPFSALTDKPTTAAGYGLTDVVTTSGTQTIDGTKTFSSTIQGSVSGSAGSVTNGVYTNGDQTVGGNKTFSGTTTLSGVADVTGSYRAGVTAVAALDINCSLGNYFTKTIAGASAFTFSNAPSSRAYSFTLELTHTSGTVTWPASVQWPGGTAPSLTTGKTHLFTFVTDDGGTRWRGVSSVNFTN